MFYVSGTNVYLMEFDQELGVYPSVKLVRDDNGYIQLQAQTTGVSAKPKDRQVCTRAEVIAQLGNLVDDYQSMTPLDDSAYQDMAPSKGM